MNEWLTTVLIAFPVAAALVVWLLPWTNQVAGSLALRNLSRCAMRTS